MPPPSLYFLWHFWRYILINFPWTYNTWLHFFSSILMHCQRRQWHPTPVLFPGKSHGWRSLVGYSPWGHWESDMTERLHFHFSLSCIGEGNGNPLQYSCLESPRDGGACWAAVYGVAQSRTRLTRLSSSSSSIALPEPEYLCAPRIPILKHNPQCDSIWRWGLWEVIRSWGKSFHEWD